MINLAVCGNLSYGVFGANISSQAMLFAKSGLELLILSIFQDQNQFIYPLTWLLVAALVVTALLQVGCSILFFKKKVIKCLEGPQLTYHSSYTI